VDAANGVGADALSEFIKKADKNRIKIEIVNDDTATATKLNHNVKLTLYFYTALLKKNDVYVLLLIFVFIFIVNSAVLIM
jgi:hypothetical protein